ncbi:MULTISPECIES: IS110 family transposase [Bacteroidales]|uniref:IS110 family transposase n=1 Tax=Bacteroidales TaxID=171549 RepID=UPI0025AEDC32|nr:MULTISPECIES: IS110 family transposase [Bacteroidales]
MQPRFKPTVYFRQCVGIDIAKSTFMACLSMLDAEGCSTSPIEFTNDRHGFNQFVRWTRKESLKGYPLCFVMEPTGVYYEALAMHLTKLGMTVHVVPANRVRDFAKYEGYKTKTDKIDAYILSMLGCENRKLKNWAAPDEQFASIRSLCRLRTSLVKHSTMLKNRLGALTVSSFSDKKTVRICSAALDDIDKNIYKAETEIRNLIDKSEQFKEAVRLSTTIPGIGQTTASAILAEVGCFANFNNHRQVVSFAGLDVVARQSGPQDPKRHISKKGNSTIRSMLYICAMSAIRFNPKMREFYDRIKKSNPSGKVALVAVMRKLLILMYSVCKSKKPYDPEHSTKN